MDGYSFQTELALWSLAVGVFLCMVYDLFRAFSVGRKQNQVLLFLRDLVFCLFAAVAMLLLFFNLSRGMPRLYSFVIAAAGFVLWRITFGRIIVALLVRVISLAEKLLNLLKMRAKKIIFRLARFIYTKNYCRSLVNKSRFGFGIIKRKEFKNEQ